MHPCVTVLETVTVSCRFKSSGGEVENVGGVVFLRSLFRPVSQLIQLSLSKALNPAAPELLGVSQLTSGQDSF